MQKERQPLSYRKILYYTLMLAVILMIGVIGYVSLTKEDTFSRERVTRLIAREWQIEAFQDTATNEISVPPENISRERFIFYPDGRALIVGQASSAFSWYYTPEDRIITLIGMEEDSTVSHQVVLDITKERLVLRAPTTIVHLIPVDKKDQ